MWWDLGPCREGEYPGSSLTAKTFSHQEDADGTWLQLGALLYSQVSWVCSSPATAPGRTSLLVGHRCFLPPSTSGWKAGKLRLCSDQRYPWAPGEPYNHWNSWHPHSMLRSASRSYFCHSSLFSKQITEESSTRQAPTPPSSDNTACKNCTAEFFVWLTFIFKLHSVL